MENNSVCINNLDYVLNYEYLNHNYELIFVDLKSKNNYKEFLNEINSFNLQSLTCIARLRYVLLFKKGEFKDRNYHSNILYEKVQFRTRDSQSKVFSNNIVQLFINQLAGDNELVSAKSNTPELFIVQPQWKNLLSNGLTQRYGLKIELNWEQDLIASVVTFTENIKNNNSELYSLNEGRGLMQRDYYHKGEVLYEKHNGHKKNLIEFVDTRDLNKFDNSKVGIINQILKKLSVEFKDCFNRVPSFKNIPLSISADNKSVIRKEIEKEQILAWDYFKNTQINLYCENDDVVSSELKNRLIAGFKSSKIFKDNSIEICEGNKAKDGLNLQILHDARKDLTVDEKYELGSSDKIIQHITVDGFGKMNHKTNEINWHFSDDKDITSDPAIINIFQNLAIKNDLKEHIMKFVSAKLIELTSKYQFFTFDWIDEKIIYVIKLSINSDGKMIFLKNKVNLDNLNNKGEISKICTLILDTWNRKSSKSKWDSLECVIKDDENYVMIQKTSKQILPLSDEVRDREVKSDKNSLFETKEVVKDIQALIDSKSQSMTSKADEQYIDVAGSIKKAINDMDAVVASIGDMKKQLGENKITFKKPVPRLVCRDLENLFGYTFNNSVRQSKPYTLFPGFKGIGLVIIDGDFYYYVGGNKSLQSRISRAIRLRKIVAITGGISEVTDIFDDLVSMMSVEFVRNGQYTVVPFVLKYMNEYLDFERRASNL